MNKINKIRNLIAILMLTLPFTACYDFIESYDLSSNNKAVYEVNLDMGKMVGMMAAMMGDQLEDDQQFAPKDTVIKFKSITDTSTLLTAEQKSWLVDGQVGVKMDIKKELFKISMNIPFKSIDALNRAFDPANSGNLRSIMAPLMKGSTLGIDAAAVEGDEEGFEEGEEEIAETENVQDKLNLLQNIYTTTFKDGKIERKFDAAKFALVKVDKDFQQLQQFSAMMGATKIQSKFILPRAVKNVKGQNIELSADKKSIVVTYTLEDLFSLPENGNFIIEY